MKIVSLADCLTQGCYRHHDKDWAHFSHKGEWGSHVTTHTSPRKLAIVDWCFPSIVLHRKRLEKRLLMKFQGRGHGPINWAKIFVFFSFGPLNFSGKENFGERCHGRFANMCKKCNKKLRENFSQDWLGT